MTEQKTKWQKPSEKTNKLNNDIQQFTKVSKKTTLNKYTKIQ